MDFWKNRVVLEIIRKERERDRDLEIICKSSIHFSSILNSASWKDWNGTKSSSRRQPSRHVDWNASISSNNFLKQIYLHTIIIYHFLPTVYANFKSNNID